MAHKVLGKFHLNGSVVYIDDTAVYGKDEKCFLQMLDMAKFNVRLKSSKCSFGMTSVEFLGHVFDKNGLHLSEKIVQGFRSSSYPNAGFGSETFCWNGQLFQRFHSGSIILFTAIDRSY